MPCVSSRETPKMRVEGPVRRLYLQFGVENNHGINYRVEDRLRVFPFVDGLLNARAKGRDIRECEYRAQNLAIDSACRELFEEENIYRHRGFRPGVVLRL